MVFLRWAVATAAVVAAALVVSDRIHGASAYEHFAGAGAGSGAPMTLEENIAEIYRDILQRQPTSKELIADTRDLRAGTLTMRGLRQRLIDTEEYARNMKLQSNRLAPELDKALSDAELFKALKDTYKAVRGKDMPANMTLQYKDIYVYLDYNEWTFRAFLADAKFADFEKEVLAVSDMDRETLLALFAKTFDKKTLVTAGIAESEAAAKRAAAGVAGAGAGGAAGSVPAGASPGDKLARPADSQDPSISATISRILEGTRDGALDKDAQARILDEIQKIQNNPNLTAEEKRQAIAAIVAIANQDAVVKATSDSIMAQYDGTDFADVPTHEGDLVLRPEFAWSVPQRRPPVCNMLGQKPSVQPLYTNSTLLLGTPLNEAAETGVGSMMPKFAFQTYQNVPIRSQQPVACAAPAPPATAPAPATPQADVPAGQAAAAVNAVTSATSYAQ